MVWVPALARLLTKPIFYVALDAAFPTFETERKRAFGSKIHPEKETILNTQSNELFILFLHARRFGEGNTLWKSNLFFPMPPTPTPQDW